MSARTHTAYGVADSPEILLARIAALEAAFDRHELEVEFADRRVRYASFDEISSRISYLKQQLAAANQRPRQFVGVAGKGVC